MVGETRQVIVQGVYELFEKERSTEWQQGAKLTRMVFIGTYTSCVHHLMAVQIGGAFLLAGYHLDRDILLQSFKKVCL